MLHDDSVQSTPGSISPVSAGVPVASPLPLSASHRPDAVISVDHVWKRYGLPVPEWVIRLLHRRAIPWALQDLSFVVRRGETLGLIGRNGAGKSTLLKVLAGVTPPSRGRVTVSGRVFSMIELNAGLHPELSGRENARLLGAIMGLTRAEMDARMPEIEAYCDIGEWFDQAVRKYSSGMLARIGFAVAVNVDADILLVDEVLAVGDLAFQRRCFDRIGQLKEKGVTILLVSHSLRQVERLCDRTILMEKGCLLHDGATASVVDEYFARVMKDEYAQAVAAHDNQMRLERVAGVDLAGVAFLDDQGQTITGIRTNDALTVRLRVKTDHPVDDPVMAVGFVTSDMLMVGAVGNEFHVSRRGIIAGETIFECRFPRLPLLPGVYALRMKMRDASSALLLSGDRVAILHVQPGEDMRFGLDKAGLVYLDAEWRMTEVCAAKDHAETEDEGL